MRTVAMAVILTGALFGQTKINGGRTVTGAWDASGATATIPARTGSALPGTCRQGEVFFNTGATPGANLYVCGTANAWSQVASGGGSVGAAGASGGLVAAIPACGPGSSGAVYYPSDSPYTLWCNGTAWQYRLGSATARPADDSTFAWVNQGAATLTVSGGITATSGDVFLTAPATAGFSPRMRVIANGNGLSFTTTAAISLFATQIGGVGTGTAGIVARNTAGPGSYTNAYCTFQYSMQFAYGAGAFTLACYDTNNGQYAGGSASGYAYVAPGLPLWMRLKCDGVNLIGQYSTDSGQNWFTAATAPVSSLSGTVNQLGWFASSDQSTAAIPASLLSWTVTTP
ncbi:MAG: hypothetical protein M3Z85_09525 [Acidobacteriota bacterium]|nr:hypothetical protein [Acidobacteriota bacterium]